MNVINVQITLQILVKMSYDMNARIVTANNRSFEMHPILTEVGLCFTFNSELASIFNPTKVQDHINLYKINFFDLETEGSLSYTYTGSNFDVKVFFILFNIFFFSMLEYKIT